MTLFKPGKLKTSAYITTGDNYKTITTAARTGRASESVAAQDVMTGCLSEDYSVAQGDHYPQKVVQDAVVKLNGFHGNLSNALRLKISAE